MIAGAGAVEVREDFLEGAAADTPLASCRELHAPFAIPVDELLVFQAREEGLQVDCVRRCALALEVAHPVMASSTSPRGQHELVEEAQEVHPGEERLDELGIEVEYWCLS